MPHERDTISEQLRAAVYDANANGVTNYRIAKDCDVSQSTLSKFMHGQRDLNMASIDKLCRYLRLELAYADRKK